MISVSEARALIHEHLPPLPVELTPLLQAQGRVLAAAVTAPVNLPSAELAALDGFAVRVEETSGRLTVSAEVRPGDTPAALPPGQVARVWAGALLPAGAEAVVPLEHVRGTQTEVEILKPVAAGQHIRGVGSEVRKGTRVLEAGQVLNPARIALLAGLGRASAAVYAPVRVAVMTLGDELAEPGQDLQPGQTYNSAAAALMALVAEAGGYPVYLGTLRGDRQAAQRMLRKALQLDVVLTAGGLARGANPDLAGSIAKLGQVLVRDVAQKPGGSFTFASAEGRPIFALPSEPAAVALCFELYVRPALRRMMGHESLERPRVIATVAQTYEKPAGRQAFLRVQLDRTSNGYMATLVPESAGPGFAALGPANGLLIVPAESTGFEPGERLVAILLEPAELCGMACLAIGGDPGVVRPLLFS